MANRFPLQSGDRAPDFSSTDSSRAGDRRPAMQDTRNDRPKGNTWEPEEQYNGISPEFGSNRSGASPAPEVWRAGSPAPTFRIPSAESSPEGAETEVREVDICLYGDGYDPKSPMRVRVVDWNVDTDYDGEPN